MSPTIKSIMSFREGLNTGKFSVLRLSPFETANDLLDGILEFAEEQASSMNEIKDALDALPKEPTESDLVALHEAILSVFTRQMEE